jgi:N utilization substance protein A
MFVTSALSPAKAQRVSIVDDAEKVMEVVVEDKQLSLAIGKKGQNVRLAAKLTGWKIDIKSEEEKRREVEIQLGALEVGEVGEQPAEGLADTGEMAEAEGAADAPLAAAGETDSTTDADVPGGPEEGPEAADESKGA